MENNTNKTVSFGSSNNTLSELPFYDLNLDEFLKVTGSWVFSATDRLLDKKDLFKDALESPNRGDDCYNYSHFIESKYCSVKQTGMHFDQAKKQNGFSIMHCNMRSLTENLSLLQDILLTMKETPNVIAISETKLKENSRMNIDIPVIPF